MEKVHVQPPELSVGVAQLLTARIEQYVSVLKQNVQLPIIFGLPDIVNAEFADELLPLQYFYPD